MRRFACLTAVAALATLVASAYADDLKSGLQPGQRIGAFNVVKVAGAENDDVKVGEELCYRCKYGARPMVMVFSRTADDKLATLHKELEKAVGDNSAKQLKAFVNLMGDNREALEKQAKEFATTAGAKDIPVVVPVEFNNGPSNYGLNPEVNVTVIVAKGNTVTATHAVASLDEASVKAILADVSKAVAE